MDTPSPPPPRALWTLTRLVFFGAGLAAVLAMLPDTPWWMGLFDHFRLHIGFGFILAGFFALLCRKWPAAVIGAMLAAAHLLALGHQGGGPEAQGHGPTLKIMSFNVLGSNTALDDLEAFVEAESPDIIVLLEVRPHLATRLRRWPGYSVQALRPREDNFGVALLSKWPMVPSETRPLGGIYDSVIGATDLGGRPLVVIGAHPPPPVSGPVTETRDRTIDAIAGFIEGDIKGFLGAMAPQGITPHVVVVGDLNATPWSQPVQKLMTSAGLWDSRRGFGYHATWPAKLGPLGIPIDHALVSGDLAVLERRVGPALGSDHRPVLLTVTPAVEQPSL
ncbi:MAG: endonuclease/exonuclease/phosphatase family protein [Bradymonadia bacterium]